MYRLSDEFLCDFVSSSKILQRHPGTLSAVARNVIASDFWVACPARPTCITGFWVMPKFASWKRYGLAGQNVVSSLEIQT